MSNDNQFYVMPNEQLQGYEIFKRDGVINPDGTKSPERICTFYSMEYLQPLLQTLREVDSMVEETDEEVIRTSPVFEG